MSGIDQQEKILAAETLRTKSTVWFKLCVRKRKAVREGLPLITDIVEEGEGDSFLVAGCCIT